MAMVDFAQYSRVLCKQGLMVVGSFQQSAVDRCNIWIVVGRGKIQPRRIRRPPSLATITSYKVVFLKQGLFA